MKQHCKLSSRQQYWNGRYESEGVLWGLESRELDDCMKVFKNEEVRKILVLGCGYGRSLLRFANARFEATGVDFSKKALEIGRHLIKNHQFVQYVLTSVCNLPFHKDSFGGIFAYNIFHLLLNGERSSLLQEIGRIVEKEGIVVVVALSVCDSNYGKGTEIEKNTFYAEREGKATHFFTEEEMLAYFKEYEIIELSKIEIHEEHSGRRHSHKALRVIAKNVCQSELNQPDFGGSIDE